MNNTKFSSMAVAGALCAFAALPSTAADVQVYGVIDTSLSFVSSDADVAGHDRVNTFSMENAKEFGSRFGLRGSEDLGNGYKVGFVLESGFKSDDGQFDQTGKLFGREAHVDLTGPFGKVSAGVLPLFGSTLGANGLFRAIDPLFANYTKAFGSSCISASSWTRVDNAISYVTPTFAGLTGYAMYSFKSSGLTTSTEGRGGESDRYASVAARYKAGAVEAIVVADTTMYGTYRTGAAASKDDGWTVTVGGNYTFDGGVRLLAFTQFFGDQELPAFRGGVGTDGIMAVTGGKSYGFVDGYGVSLGVNVPALGGVAKASIGYRDMENKIDVDFKRVIAALGYDYAISKRTAVYAMTGWSQEKVETAAMEAKPNGYEFTAGIVHRF